MRTKLSRQQKNNIGKSKVDMKIGNNIKNTRYYNAMKILNKYEL